MSQPVSTAARAASMGFFRADEYATRQPDLADIDPAHHFSEHGIWEGRQGADPETLTAAIATAIKDHTSVEPSDAMLERGYRRAARSPVRLLSPLQPTALEADLTEWLTRTITAAGGEPQLQLGSEAPALADIVVSPGQISSAWPKDARLALTHGGLAACVCSPSEAGFRLDLPHLIYAHAAASTDASSVALLKAAGMSVVDTALPLRTPSAAPPDHPLVQGLSRAARSWEPGGAWGDRPIHVACLQALTPQRAASWRVLAPAMAGKEIVVYSPHDGAEDRREATLRRYIFARSRIVLHLQADGAPRCPSSELLREIAESGALLLTEPSPHPPWPAKAGEHYLQQSLRRMPAEIERLLETSWRDQPAAPQAAALARAINLSSRDPELVGLDLLSRLPV